MSEDEKKTLQDNDQESSSISKQNVEDDQDELYNHSLVYNYDSFSSTMFSVTLVCFLLSSAFLIYFSFNMVFSDRATVVDMPFSVGTKPAYILNNFTRSNKLVKKNSIRRFIRDSLLLMSPRNERDAAIFYDALENYATPGSVFDSALGNILDNKEEQISKIGSGRFNRIYLSRMPNSFRASVEGDRVAAEVDLVYIENGMNEYRFTPTCEFVLKVGERTVKNEYGLYISYIECFQLVDATSGKKERVKILGRFGD